MEFSKATKCQSKLRAALFGPSGAGKTYSALRIANGMGGRIAVIDTEHGSASKYADKFDFDVCELTGKQDVGAYIEAINTAGKAGYGVLLIDSMTHGWRELLEEIDRLARTKYRGNTWSAWSEGTPKQHEFVNALLEYPGHIIATIRSKTEWTTEQGRNGKSAPVRVGLAPEQGKGIEYEFDLLLELSTEHIATVIKDRTGKFQDQTIDKPGEDFGKALVAWLSEGADSAVPDEPPPGDSASKFETEITGPDPQHIQDFNAMVEKHNIQSETIVKWLSHYGVDGVRDFTPNNVVRLCATVEARAQKAALAATSAAVPY